MKTESSFPRADQGDDPIPEPVVAKAPEPPAPAPPAEPPLEFGDLMVPPVIDEYSPMAEKGAGYLIRLAKGLEEKNESFRALLAWERVLDRAKADPVQAAEALASIRRLRPTLPIWNATPKSAVTIKLQAGAGKTLSKPLTRALESMAHAIATSSSGILAVNPAVSVGKGNSRTKGPMPVALWMTGAIKKPRSSEVVSFTVESSDALPASLGEATYRLVSGYLSKIPEITPPSEIAEGEDPAGALEFRITRLMWQQLAGHLNLPPEKP